MAHSGFVLPPVILVVDSDPDSLELYSILLKNEGFVVFDADDVDTALQQAIAVKLDIILVELRLPRLEGFEVCTRLKAAPDTCTIPIVFISAAGDRPIIEQAYALGAVDFILKPCRVHYLVAHLYEHLQPVEE